jgi:hypothetical protein
MDVDLLRNSFLISVPLELERLKEVGLVQRAFYLLMILFIPSMLVIQG